MEIKQKILLHNFPQCSMLKNEILLNANEDKIQFITSESILKTIDEIKEHKKIKVLFYSTNIGDYDAMLKDIKAINDGINANVDGIMIFPELDRKESRKFRDQGVTKFFTPEDHSADIVEYFETFSAQKNPMKDDRIVISAEKKDSISKPKPKVELKVDANSEHFEEVRSHILENTDAKNIKLESGELNVCMKTPTFPNIECKLEDFSQNDLEVEILSFYNPQVGENIDVNVIFAYNRCKVELTLSGEVTEINESLNSRSLITINLVHDESLSLQNFMALYQKRQKSIDEFMTLARGS